MTKTLHQLHLESEKIKADAELKLIIDKPILEPQEIWNLYPENFFLWRKKYDYPRILAHFSQKLNGFDDWKKEYNFTDDMLMNYGISHCINSNPSKNKYKYIVERKWEDEESNFISYQNIDGKFYNLGPN